MSAKVAVIGASSFSGRAFARLAEASGHAVMHIARPDFDLLYPKRIAEAINDWGCEYVVNFAALNMVAESWQHSADYYQVNVIGVTELARALRRESLRAFVQVSTPEVYGRTHERLNTDAPFAPSTPYAVSRAATDMHLKAMFNLDGFPVRFTRTVNVYGAGQQLYRIVPRTVLSIARGVRLPLHGGGASERSFIHIDDVARGIQRVLKRGRDGETYHMASSSMVAIRGLVEKICGMMAAKFEDVVEMAPERGGKDPVYWLNDACMRAELEWRDLVPLEAGLRDVVSWYAVHERAGHFRGASLDYTHRR